MSKPARSRSSMPAHLRPITVNIPPVWAPEQALAVLDLLDDLREKIWTRYGDQVRPLLQGFAEHAASHDDANSCDDPSF
jgi:hypothetical protein